MSQWLFRLPLETLAIDYMIPAYLTPLTYVRIQGLYCSDASCTKACAPRIVKNGKLDNCKLKITKYNKSSQLKSNFALNKTMLHKFYTPKEILNWKSSFKDFKLDIIAIYYKIEILEKASFNSINKTILYFQFIEVMTNFIRQMFFKR